LDIWYEILILLDIVDEISLSKAFPRFFGAFILSKQVIRFQNAINSYMRSDEVDLPVGPPASFIRFLSRNSSLEYTSLVSWLRPVLSSSIVLNRKLFEDLSSIIASKDRGFVSVSSSLSSWAAEMKGECETECSIFACVDEVGGIEAIFNRNDHAVGIWNHPVVGPVFGSMNRADLFISDDCDQAEFSGSTLGVSYGGRTWFE
jgi:hypothetical protein